MKRVLMALLLCAWGLAHGQPFLLADPVPAGVAQPTSYKFSINGGPLQACAVVTAADGSVQMKCDLAGTGVPVPGVTYTGKAFTFVAVATNSAGDSPSSSPFVYPSPAKPAAPGTLRISGT